MSALTAETILAIWERAPTDDPVRGPLSVLTLARPDLSEDELLDMSVGERDASILQLRRQLFGESLNGFIACPRCGERLEFDVSIDDLGITTPVGQDARELRLDEDGLSATVRAPNSRDLLALQDCADPAVAALELLERCTADIAFAGRAFDARELPSGVVTWIGERLAQAQAAADIGFDIACGACGHRWQAPLDIASYFQEELRRLARDLLDQVHQLAMAYGWQEQAVLAMHPQRRQAYLDRVLG